MATGKQVAQARQRAKLGGPAAAQVADPKHAGVELARQIARGRQAANLAAQAERQARRQADDQAPAPTKGRKPGKGG